MQRNQAELETMTHEQLVERVLEMQDILRESLLVREAMQALINKLLILKEEEVGYFAGATQTSLSGRDQELQQVWARARHAVANPSGLVKDKEIDIATISPDLVLPPLP